MELFECVKYKCKMVSLRCVQYYFRENFGQGNIPYKSLCKDCEEGKLVYESNVGTLNTCQSCGLPIESERKNCRGKACFQKRMKKTRMSGFTEPAVSIASPIELETFSVCNSDAIESVIVPQDKPKEKREKKGEKKQKASKGKEVHVEDSTDNKPKVERSKKPKRSTSVKARKKKRKKEEETTSQGVNWIRSPKHAIEIALSFYETAKPDAFDNGVVREGIDEGSSKALSLYKELKLYAAMLLDEKRKD